jgi:hypothetical protein
MRVATALVLIGFCMAAPTSGYSASLRIARPGTGPMLVEEVAYP